LSLFIASPPFYLLQELSLFCVASGIAIATTLLIAGIDKVSLLLQQF